MKSSSPDQYTSSIVSFRTTLGETKLLLQLLSSITNTCPKRTNLMWVLKWRFSLFSTYVELYHSSTILWPSIFQCLFHHSQHVFRSPWWSAALAHTIACGPTTFQPSAQVSMFVSPLTARFPLTMVVSSFGPYHCLWPNNAPAEYAGVTPTPWAMMPTLGCVSYHRGHELIVRGPALKT